jgi:PTH1 family peptidyl-tRNA hydrolase
MGKAILPDGQSVWLVEPQTYMNSSGQAVAAILGFHGIEPGEAVVVMDDADLPMGRMRIRTGGSSGGHRGLDSVIESLGTADVPRLRVGIGRERAGAGLVEHVLSPFSADERAWVAQVVDQAAEAVLAILLSGVEAAMNRYNGLTIQAGTADDTKARKGQA